jgi:hypothetical protein
MGYLCNFHKSAQSKQSLNGRKFTQSGHPDLEAGLNLKPVALRVADLCEFFELQKNLSVAKKAAYPPEELQARVRFPPGYKVFMDITSMLLGTCNCNVHSLCVEKREMKALAPNCSF